MLPPATQPAPSQNKPAEVAAVIREGKIIPAWEVFSQPGGAQWLNDIDPESGMAPLHVAASLGDVALSMLLYSKGASLALPDASGSTALHLAARKGSFHLVTFLVNAGADPLLQDHSGRTPARVAEQEHGVCELSQFLRLAEANPHKARALASTTMKKQQKKNKPNPPGFTRQGSAESVATAPAEAAEKLRVKLDKIVERREQVEARLAALRDSEAGAVQGKQVRDCERDLERILQEESKARSLLDRAQQRQHSTRPAWLSLFHFWRP